MLRLALLLFLPFFCCAQNAYHADSIRFASGLPSDVVLATLKKDGFLYVATQRGLCLYDGYLFVDAKDVKNVVGSIFSDRRHIYFEEAGVGLCEKDNIYSPKKVIQVVRFDDNNPDNDHFQNIYKDRYGNIWAADFHNIKYFSSATGKWRSFLIAPDNQSLNLAADYIPCKNGLIITTSAGIFYWRSKEDRLMPINKASVTSSLQKQSRIFCFNGNSSLCEFFPETNTIKPFVEMKDSCFFVKEYQVNNELMYYSNKALFVYNLQEGKERKLFESNNKINHVYYDSLINIVWLSTQNGLIKLQKNNVAVQSIVLPENSNTLISDMLLDKSGNLWMATVQGTLLQKTGQGKWKKYHIGKQISSISIKDTTIYIAADSNIYRLSPEGRPEKIITENFPLKKAIEAENKIWVVPVMGSVKVYEGFSFKEIKNYVKQDSNFFQNNFVNDICYAHGKVWLATWAPKDYGIAFFDKLLQRFESVSKIKSNDSLFVGDYYNRIAIAENGSLLFSAHGGWNRIFNDGHILQSLNTRTYNIANDNIQGIAEDQRGNIWFGCAEGLYQFNNNTKTAVRISEIDGLASNNITGGFCLDKNNVLYIATERNVQQIDLLKVLKTSLINLLQLTAVKCNGTFISPLTNALSQKEKDITQIELYFSALNFTDKEKVVYRYRFDDEPWSYLGSEPHLQIIKPAAGHYKVTIEAGDNLGNWQSKALIFQLNIMPPFYKTAWFYVLLILLAALLAWIINRYLVRQETLKGNLRRKIKENENRMLRSQMNPHFMFNSLNSINSFIIQNKKEEASVYLTSFSRLMRKILDNSRKEFISLQEELDATVLYLNLEAVRMEHKFDYRINVHSNIDATAIFIPPLILQPFLENAIWHGINQKDAHGFITIDIEPDKENTNRLIVTIIDDGVGRKATHRPEHKAYKSHGLEITMERLRMNDRDNCVKIIDLYDENNVAAGTKVQLQIIYNYD
jgi:ligand-binding sensor domain-containing protein/two-component sensor histidine kinase